MSAPTPSPEVLRANIAGSVRTAEQVLAHLETSLRRAGFEEGLAAYRKMGETLVGQRLWSQRERNEEIEQLFAALSGRARSIYGLLEPYSELMRKIASLDALAKPQPESAELDALGRTILDALAVGEMSLTALRSRLSASRGEIETRLGQLENDGRVKSRVASGRRLYRSA